MNRWLTHLVSPSHEDKKAMLDQHFAAALDVLNKKYSAKLTPQQMLKAQLAHHVAKAAAANGSMHQSAAGRSLMG